MLNFRAVTCRQEHYRYLEWFNQQEDSVQDIIRAEMQEYLASLQTDLDFGEPYTPPKAPAVHKKARRARRKRHG